MAFWNPIHSFNGGKDQQPSFIYKESKYSSSTQSYDVDKGTIFLSDIYGKHIGDPPIPPAITNYLDTAVSSYDNSKFAWADGLDIHTYDMISKTEQVHRIENLMGSKGSGLSYFSLDGTKIYHYTGFYEPYGYTPKQLIQEAKKYEYGLRMIDLTKNKDILIIPWSPESFDQSNSPTFLDSSNYNSKTGLFIENKNSSLAIRQLPETPPDYILEKDIAKYPIAYTINLPEQNLEFKSYGPGPMFSLDGNGIAYTAVHKFTFSSSDKQSALKPQEIGYFDISSAKNYFPISTSDYRSKGRDQNISIFCAIDKNTIIYTMRYRLQIPAVGDYSGDFLDFELRNSIFLNISSQHSIIVKGIVRCPLL